MLQWIPKPDEPDIEKHPLASLKRTDTVIHLTRLLNEIPLDRLLDIEKIIKDEIKK